nr:acyl-[acyl-carrier-protein]--UDP-N-acetylglucosamine O-acyltransferase [Candidatus Omnitrophota bacterium]
MEIHPTALVSKKATIASDVIIGAYSRIEDNVVIGRGAQIGSH